MKNRHPVIEAAVVGVTFVAAAEFMVIFVIPAWAVSFPVGGYTVDLGELAPWAGVLIAFGVWWDARQARKAAAAALLAAKEAVVGIADVKKQTDGVLKEVASFAKTQGQQQERADVATAKELVRSDRMADAEVEAKIRAAKGDNKSGDGGDDPLSVKDDIVAKTTARAADALERSASAAEQSTENAAEKNKK